MVAAGWGPFLKDMYELILELVGKGTRWQFANHEIRIGRDPNCDLVLPTEKYPMVSRSHLLIRQAAERYWVEDLNTPGGTFVNGGQIQVSPLSDGDVLRLGVDGPELRANIITSYRLAGSEVSARRQSTSAEVPTRLKTETSIKSSQEAPTNGKVTVASTAATEPQSSITAGESPDDSGLPVAVEPVSEAKTPALKAEPAKIQTVPPKPGSSNATSAVFSPDKSKPAGDFIAPDMALMERKLKTIRNLTVVAILLTMIFGLILLYHIWK
jgi:predicted component of type VI protein secretion system